MEESYVTAYFKTKEFFNFGFLGGFFAKKNTHFNEEGQMYSTQ